MSHDKLPLPDYDQLPIGSVQHRIRSLDDTQLRALIEHERQHGNRTPILEILTARLDQLANGAQPSGGEQRQAPEVTSTAGGSPVDPVHSPDDNTPLRHGVYGQTPARGRD
ncbi:MAG: hypothetical protein ACJ72N_05195 [Labedaea sp.]